MILVEVCVSSSCHIKGAPEIVALMQKNITESHLEDEVILSGSLCPGKCNRIGVTVTVDNEVYVGITTDNFYDFWKETVMPAVDKSRKEKNDHG